MGAKAREVWGDGDQNQSPEAQGHEEGFNQRIGDRKSPPFLPTPVCPLTERHAHSLRVSFVRTGEGEVCSFSSTPHPFSHLHPCLCDRHSVVGFLLMFRSLEVPLN